MQFFVYLTQIEHSIGTIIFILDSTDRRFAEVLKTPYHDKHSMKFIGSTAHNYRAKMIELVILALAKTIEDLISAIEKNEGIKIRFWQDLGGYKFYKKARLVRHLANVIKHHEGVINKGFNVHDCDVLIDEFGFPDDFLISNWKVEEKGPDSCLYKNTYWIEQFYLDIISKKFNVHDLTSNIPDAEIKENMVNKWLNEFINFESNKENN